MLAADSVDDSSPSSLVVQFRHMGGKRQDAGHV